MSWPLALAAVLACGAGWLVLRPLRAAATARLGPKGRGLADAGALCALAILLFGFRLAPFGVIVLVLAGGAVAKGLRRDDPVVAPPPPARGMTEAEALSVLGLEPGADADAIDAAHRRMIVRAHPDQGGSDYLAAKVNEARAVLRR